MFSALPESSVWTLSLEYEIKDTYIYIYIYISLSLFLSPLPLPPSFFSLSLTHTRYPLLSELVVQTISELRNQTDRFLDSQDHLYRLLLHEMQFLNSLGRKYKVNLHINWSYCQTHNGPWLANHPILLLFFSFSHLFITKKMQITILSLWFGATTEKEWQQIRRWKKRVRHLVLVGYLT